MVTSLIKGTAGLTTIGVAFVLSLLASRSEACEPSDLVGRVKSVIVTEAVVDSATGKIVGVRNVLRKDVSQDGRVAETTLALSAGDVGPPAKSTTYFENGRPVRGFQTVKGKTVPSMTCSYDAQGRLVEARTGSEYSEFGFVDTYEYGPGFIRRRTNASPGGRSVSTQTLDADGRVIKEVVLDEPTSAVQRTTETTYEGNRKDVCGVSALQSRRDCGMTVLDSHGNEIDFIAEGRTRKTAIEYDSVGNWISKRIRSTGVLGIPVEIIVQRKIDYW